MTRSRSLCLVSSLILVGFAAGCRSTGPAAGDASVMAETPRVDVRNEVGENGLPTARALVARFVDALGGEKTLRAHSSSTTRGSMELAAMGMSGDLVRYAAAPDKMVMIIEMSGFGTMNQGFNGEVGWSDNPMQGATLLEGRQLHQMEQQAAYYGPLAYADLYPEMETVELTEFNGESAYKVRLVDEEGSEIFQYFSEESSLILGTEMQQENPQMGGTMDVRIKLADYEDFGGGLVPTQTVMEMMGMVIRQTVSEVTYDDVEETAFAPPDSVKALLE